MAIAPPPVSPNPQQILAQTNKIQSEINGIDASLNKVIAADNQSKLNISRITGKSKYKAELQRLQTTDLTIINLNNQKTLLTYNIQQLTGTINSTQYNTLIKTTQTLYNNNIQNNTNQQNIQIALLNQSDPTTNQKSTNQQQQQLKNNLKSQISYNQNQAATNRLSAIAKGTILSVLPVTIELVSQKIINSNLHINSLNSEIDSLNIQITQVNSSPTPQGIQVVTNRKNAILNEINTTEKSINDIKNYINNINIILQIYTITTTIAETILASLPQPPASTIGYQSVVYKITGPGGLIDQAKTIIGAINVILPIILIELNKIINELEDIKSKIDNIEGELEGNVVSSQILPSNQTSNMSSNITYKGFTLVIETENILGAPVVLGMHRHYAAALDSNNVPVLKTDLSFTQDTQVLIDQLKFIIDSNKLIA
jgi:hypothetical protein